jgi:hypothetical protein
VITLSVSVKSARLALLVAFAPGVEVVIGFSVDVGSISGGDIAR